MKSKKHSSHDKEKSDASNLKKPFRRYGKWIVIFILIIGMFIVEFGLWNGSHVGSTYRNISLKLANNSWLIYADRSKVEKDIKSNLMEMSNFLEANQIDSAMEFVHPDQRDSYYSQFAAYPERLPYFIEGLRSAKLVFISEKLNAYDSERLARVKLYIPEDTSSDVKNPYTLTCILLEEKWVIDS